MNIECGTVHQMPIERIINAASPKRDERILEVMEILFSKLPNTADDAKADFTLSDGTECRVIKFAAPRERDSELWYGFDVKFKDDRLAHLEFTVKCSGWAGSV